VIALDASVLIGFLDEDDAHHEEAFDFLMATDDYLMHTMTLAEVLVRGVRDGTLAALEQRIREIGVVEQPRAATEAVQLARLRSDTGLRLPDCCVFLVAEAAGASLATFDDRLARVARASGLDVLEGPRGDA
jgi:predicted nucleic acid-binding protein